MHLVLLKTTRSGKISVLFFPLRLYCEITAKAVKYKIKTATDEMCFHTFNEWLLTEWKKIQAHKKLTSQVNESIHTARSDAVMYAGIRICVSPRGGNV